MALPRTPVNKNNVVQSNEYSQFEEIQNEDLITVNSDNETLQDHERSRIPRSTSFSQSVLLNSQNNHTPNLNNYITNTSVHQNDNRTNLNQIINGESSRATTLFRKSPNKILKICNICKKDATRHAFICKGCSKICHPICLLDDEEGTVDGLKETYVCNTCINVLNNLNNNNKKPLNDLNVRRSKFNVHQHDDSEISEDEMILKSPVGRPSHAKSNNRSKFSNESNSRNMSRSISDNEIQSYFIKLQYQKLPLVTDSDLSWTVFYSAFVRTKELFDADENVTRIQAAINDDTVKRIGGKGLFNPRTFEKCIEDVNKRLKHNINFLTNEATFIENHGKIKAENKSKLVEFIDRVRNFCTMTEAYNDTSYVGNKRFLANVSDVVPFYLKNKWEAKQADLEDRGIIPNLNHLIQIFDKELPRIEASIRNDKIRNTDKKSENNKPNDKAQRFHNTTTKTNNKFNHSYFGTPNTDIEHHQNNENEFLCWLHKTNDHIGNRCKNLWEMDGKTVSHLAKLHKICTFCGQKQHKPCPFSAKLKCKTAGCDFLHHSLFCYKRKGKSYNTNQTSNENNVTSNNNPLNATNAEMNTKSQTSQTQQGNNAEEDDSEAELQEIIKRFTNIKNCTHINNPPKENNTMKVLNGQAITNYKNENPDKTLLSVVVVELENQQKAAFLLDSGSTVSLIEEEIANNLDLKGPWYPLTLMWSGEMKRKEKLSRVVEVKVSSLTEEKQSHKLFFRTVKDLKMCNQKFRAHKIYEKYPHLRELKLIDYDKISGVIGIDNLFAFERTNTIKAIGKIGHDYHGVQSPLGNYIYGTTDSLETTYKCLSSNDPFLKENRYFAHALSDDEQKEYELMEKEIMRMEYNLPSLNDKIIHDEKLSLDLLNSEFKKTDNDNHYIFPLWWVQIIILPYTLVKYILSKSKWKYNFKIMRNPYGEEKIHLIGRNLGVEKHQFNAIEKDSINDYPRRKLGNKDKFKLWKKCTKKKR